MPVRRPVLSLALAAAASAAIALAAAPAVGQDGPPYINPCDDPLLALKCPNLRMSPPGDLHVQRAGSQLRLLATNHIVNTGQGPLEVRADRTQAGGRDRFPKAYQVVYDRQGRPVYFPEAGYVYWKAIPGQGHYWKYYRAARFELWTLNTDGSRGQLLRTGPKLSYCFRDLRRVRSYARTPRGRIYPGCSQDFGRKELRLGVSPGWADIYPSTYHENWISVTGLRGCFAFVHRADPMNALVEEREDDNIGERVIRLPPRRGSVAPRGCPSPR
jgi:hypothetical protein